MVPNLVEIFFVYGYEGGVVEEKTMILFMFIANTCDIYTVGVTETKQELSMSRRIRWCIVFNRFESSFCEPNKNLCIFFSL